MNFSNAVKTAFARSKRDFWEIYSRTWKVILIFAVPLEVFYQFFMQCANSPHEELQITGKLGISMVDITWSVVFLMVLPVFVRDLSEGKKKTDVIAHLKKFTGPVAIEGLRAFGRTALMFLLLIVPGFIAAIRLYFVPYIVQFDKEYDKGNVDALEESISLVKGNTWQIFGILLLAGIPIYAISWLKMSYSFEDDTVVFSIIFLIRILIEVFADIFIYSIYEYLVLHKDKEAKGRGS